MSEWSPHQQLRQAALHDQDCQLCEHRCRVDRRQGPGGFCKTDHTTRVFRHRVEYGDEREIAPSHLFYVSGCDLRCAFCINEINAFDSRRGELLTSEFFQLSLQQNARFRPKTMQWVGGEPTIHLPRILQVMHDIPDHPKVVWKTDGHGTPEAYALMKGWMDIYLVDYKFGINACAERIAKVPNYIEILQRNLQIMANQGELIIRHLLLPGHLDCCFRPLVEWVRHALPQAKFSLREGYLPHWQANHYVELGRPLQRVELTTARQIVANTDMIVVPA